MTDKSLSEVFQKELADHKLMVSVCEQIADGGKIEDICQKMDITKSYIYSLVRRVPEFREMYERAREFHADAIYDEILQIADTPVMGEKTVTKGNGSTEIITGDMIEHRRLQIESRMRVASKLRRSKYGDKQTHEHQGPGGGMIPIVAVTMTPNEAAEAYRLTLEQD